MTQKLDERYELLDLNDNLSTQEAHHLIDEVIAKHRASIDEATAKHGASIDQANAKLKALIDEAMAKHDAFIDEAVAKHTASMRALDLSILALKTQRNTFSPIIRRLSPEILYKIFYFVRDNNSEIFIGEDGGRPMGELNPLTWVNMVNVTHVSRYWRSVAIDWPSLWAHPPFSNLTWAEEMIRRSKEASLVIDIALKHTQRIKHLSIYAEADYWPEMLPTLPKSIPQLQSLCLSSSYATRSPYNGSAYPKPIFGLENIPSGRSELCSLELNYFTVNWDSQSTLLHSLTYLKLHGTVPSPHLTWKWLVDVLKGTPRLEVLDLKDSFPACSEEYVAYYGSAHLGFLRELYVCCEPEEGGTFLSCITLPPTTSITIDCCVNLHDVLSTSAITFSNTFISLAHLYSNMVPVPDFRTLTLLQPLLPWSSLGHYIHLADMSVALLSRRRCH
ncbi:hypothetical protein BJ912DRAFT_1012910 [Pholiota molesta]|nr:hypothetical protein BJ912DRAFT_1012910 [Pholiota molesta]